MRINLKHKESVENALLHANGNNGKHCFWTAQEVWDCATEAERLLDQYGVPVTRRKGARYYSLSKHPGDFPKSYQRKTHGVKMTSIILERGARHWFLVNCTADRVSILSGQQSRLIITHAQAEEADKARRKHFNIILTPAD